MILMKFSSHGRMLLDFQYTLPFSFEDVLIIRWNGTWSEIITWGNVWSRYHKSNRLHVTRNVFSLAIFIGFYCIWFISFSWKNLHMSTSSFSSIIDLSMFLAFSLFVASSIECFIMLLNYSMNPVGLLCRSSWLRRWSVCCNGSLLRIPCVDLPIWGEIWVPPDWGEVLVSLTEVKCGFRMWVPCVEHMCWSL